MKIRANKVVAEGKEVPNNNHNKAKIAHGEFVAKNKERTFGGTMCFKPGNKI